MAYKSSEMIRNTNHNYDFPPYRPPNEAGSALIRASRGCPWNKCLFCTMYKDIKFQPRPLEEIKKDIDNATHIYSYAKNVFIADSDSLTMKHIEEIIKYIKQKLPHITRITSYARAKTLSKLGVERLEKLRKVGLTRVHVGLESGCAETLKFMHKGATPEDMIAGGLAAKQAGLQLSFYILIGAGGTQRLKQHAQESAHICNEVNPDFMRLRTLVVQRGSPLEQEKINGNYTTTSPIEKILEVKTFLEKLKLNNCELASDHFTNNIWVDNKLVYQGINGILPQDKQNMLIVLSDTYDFLSVTNGEILDATILYDQGMISSL